jgi:uncharacterized protein (TIGR02646 family)
MRPVDKGQAPRVYTDYQQAQMDLQTRLGDYCSYCERQIETNLAVEHVRPKSLVPALRNRWSNFLLSCGNCNSSKGHTPVDLHDYLWPDSENTLLAFKYVRGGIVQPNPALSPSIRAKAIATIRLVGLDRDPGNARRKPTKADQRWRRREEAWKLAELCRGDLAKQDTPAMRKLIVHVATGRGEFSVWWTVFADDIDMRRRLRQAFAGTHSGSFDVNEDLVARAGGQI